MIWHIYSGQHCFKGVLGKDLSSSGDVALTMRQVPCEFQANWPNFIFQPVAPDVIWHIYSRQCCFKGVLGMDLLSSGDVALMMGQVPCEFRADWPTFIFQPVAPDMIWHIYSGRCCFKEVGGMDLPSSGDVALTMGQVSCEFQADQPNFIFQGNLRQGDWQCSSPRFARLVHSWQLLTWFGTFTPGGAASRGKEVSTSHLQDTPPHHLGQGPCEFWEDQPTFIFQGKLRQGTWQWSSPRFARAVHGWRLLMWFGTFTLGFPAQRGKKVSTSCLCSTPPYHLGQVPCDFQEDRPMFVRVVHGWRLQTWIWHIYSLQCCFMGDSAIHLPSSGEVLLGLGKVPCEFGRDQTKHWGSYPWGVCQGPRPLKSESRSMEWPPAQTVRGCWGELRAAPLPAPWALAGPGEKSKVLADGGQLYPLIMQPHNVLEICSFLHVEGDISGHPRQKTILLGYGYPRQGEGWSQKLRVLLLGQSHSGLPPDQTPCVPPKWLPAWSGPTSPHTPAKVAKR